MSAWLIAVAVGVAAALFQYARLGAPSALIRGGLAALRAAALIVVVALVLNAPLGRARRARPWAFVDASESMTRQGAPLWRIAWDSARAAAADSTWIFGDSVRRGDRARQPTDATSRLRPVVERTMIAGRPAIVVTDGEVQDSSALEGLPAGSRVIVLRRPETAGGDAAVQTLEAPRAVVDGDSVSLRVPLVAGARGAATGSLMLQLDQQVLGRWPVDTLPQWGERQYDVRVRVAGVAGGRPAILRAIVASGGDAEPRNDTLATALEISRAASAVFVSTSPDQDARFALAILRGALALPTRGYLRVAPGNWRQEGTLAAVSERDVRQALRDAPIAIIHGDTSIFGSPQSASFGGGPLALFVPPDAEDGEWYPSATPVSPISGALAAIPLDSLPPVSAGTPARGDWTALEARRGREAIQRPVVVGRETPRRAVTITASGFWRWRFRGGVSADAYAALLGSIFDWLAAERADRRSAVPDENVVRAGQPIRWRRGSSADSLVRIAVRRQGATRSDTLTLRFPAGVAIQETPPFPAGVYDVAVPGGRSTLVVNAAAELLPTRPRLQSGQVGRRASVDDASRARASGWLYALVIALLCVEWIARRRAGLR